MKVVVVGAGLSGLAAADELRQAGSQVRIFEARDRVGGRVWSTRFGESIIERGAEFIQPQAPATKALVDRLGLHIVARGMPYGNRDHRGVAQVSAADLHEAVACIRSAFGASTNTTWADSASVAEGLDRIGVTQPAADILAARLEILFASPADDLPAALIPAIAGAFGNFDGYSLDGGNSQLPEALSESSEVHLSSPVSHIAWSDDRVRITARGVETEADAAVVTVPSSAMDAITFEPALPESKRSALNAVRYGHVAKLFVGLRSPAPPSATVSVPGRFWCYTQADGEGGNLPVLTAFAGTSSALEALQVSNGPECWLAALAELRPDLDLDTSNPVLSTWLDDPWARGAYSARSVRAPLNHAEVVRPIARIAFAGEHAAGEWHGQGVEGAIRSGIRAAHDVRSMEGSPSP